MLPLLPHAQTTSCGETCALLHAGAGLTAVVKARYEIRSNRRIALSFEEAGIGEVHISKELEQLLAPALLPRTWFTHRLLLAIREVLSSSSESASITKAYYQIVHGAPFHWSRRLNLYYLAVESGRWEVGHSVTAKTCNKDLKPNPLQLGSALRHLVKILMNGIHYEPRKGISVLQLAVQFKLTIPLRRGLPTALQDRADRLARNVGSEYLLTYLDEEILIGRQTGSGGSFIFERVV